MAAPDGTLLMEREALKLLNAKIGEQLTFKMANGTVHQIAISGVVHDPSLAPAWQEQTAYGYITPTTLKILDDQVLLNTLKILVKDQPFNLQVIESRMSELATWLQQQGRVVKAIHLPLPGKHPHEVQMRGMLLILLLSCGLTLVLCAVLTATMIHDMLAQQIRQIGVMKAIGARSYQIAQIYLMLTFLIGLAATCIGPTFGRISRTWLG